MACSGDRAPCSPRRISRISSRSPACVLGALPSRMALHASSSVFFSGITSLLPNALYRTSPSPSFETHSHVRPSRQLIPTEEGPFVTPAREAEGLIGHRRLLCTLKQGTCRPIKTSEILDQSNPSSFSERCTAGRTFIRSKYAGKGTGRARPLLRARQADRIPLNPYAGFLTDDQERTRNRKAMPENHGTAVRQISLRANLLRLPWCAAIKSAFDSRRTHGPHCSRLAPPRGRQNPLPVR